jgi:hypothetical protein
VPIFGEEKAKITMMSASYLICLRRNYCKNAVRPPVIEQHCVELSESDGIVVIHPNWWGQPPAIPKGWRDRVFRPGVAYRIIPLALCCLTLPCCSGSKEPDQTKASDKSRTEQWPEGWHAANAVGSVEEEPVIEEQVTEEDMNALCSIKGPEPVIKGIAGPPVEQPRFS